MMHKAWSNIEEAPYCFFKIILQISRSHETKKTSILTQIGRFRTVPPVRIHWWLWNDAQSLKQYRRGALRFSVKFQGHTGQQIVDFDPNWVFPDCNLSLNLPMALKWCTKLNIAQKRYPIVFQGHPSNFKVTWDQKLPILTWIERFRTVTPVWIHGWIWNDAQSFM